MTTASPFHPTSSSELAASFAENGFYHARGVFSPDEVAELESEFDRIVRRITGAAEETNARWGGAEMDRLGAAGTVVTHTHNVQQFSAVWMRALLHPGFLAVATAILGPNVALHHTKLFQKPAENGAPFPMHQDWSYFPTERDTMMAGIIHVSAATDEMGCLRVYPGSHRRGRLDDSNGTKDGVMTDEFPIARATPMEAEPGDVLFFHYLTVHGSMPNRSDRTRKTVLVQMRAGDDPIEAGVTHPDENLALAGFNASTTRGSAGAKGA